MNKNGSIAIVILGLVAVIALVGIILLFTDGVTGNAHSTSCIDSDGGKNYKSRGLVGVGIASAEDTCLRFPDLAYAGPDNAVKDGLYLAEAYCKDGVQVAFDVYTCPKGCVNGACVQAFEQMF
jgi:hypothetical protein